MRVSFIRIAVALGVAVTAIPAAAEHRLTCRDGDPNIVLSPYGPGGTPFCSRDQPKVWIGGLCPRHTGSKFDRMNDAW